MDLYIYGTSEMGTIASFSLLGITGDVSRDPNAPRYSTFYFNLANTNLTDEDMTKIEILNMYNKERDTYIKLQGNSWNAGSDLPTSLYTYDITNWDSGTVYRFVAVDYLCNHVIDTYFILRAQNTTVYKKDVGSTSVDITYELDEIVNKMKLTITIDYASLHSQNWKCKLVKMPLHAGDFI